MVTSNASNVRKSANDQLPCRIYLHILHGGFAQFMLIMQYILLTSDHRMPVGMLSFLGSLLNSAQVSEAKGASEIRHRDTAFFSPQTGEAIQNV